MEFGRSALGRRGVQFSVLWCLWEEQVLLGGARPVFLHVGNALLAEELRLGRTPGIEHDGHAARVIRPHQAVLPTLQGNLHQ